MNQLLRLLLLLCLTTQCLAQSPYEHIYSGVRTSSIRASCLVGQDLYIAGHLSDCYSPILRKGDAQVNSILAGPGDGYWSFDDVYFLPHQDSIFITGGYYRLSDDVITGTDSPRLIAYYLDGTVKFDTIIPLGDFTFTNESRLNFTVNDQDNIVVTHLDTVYIVSLDGALLNKVHHPGTIISDIIPLNDSMMLAASGTDVIWMNNMGRIIDRRSPSNIEVLSLARVDGRAFAIYRSLLLEIPQIAGEQAQIFADLSPTLMPEGLTGNSDAIFIWGKDDQDDLMKFYEYDLNTAESIGSESLDFEGVTVVDVEATDEQLFLSGNFRAPGHPLNSSFVKAVDILNFNYYVADIALDEVRILNELSVSYEPIPNDTLIYYSARPLIYEFDVRNLGTDTVSALSFYSNKYDGFNCAVASFYNYIDNIVIPPGETITLTDSSTYVFKTTTSSNTIPSLDFHVFAPNHHFDGNTDNNGKNTDLLLSNEEVLAPIANSIAVFPNPADQSVQVLLSQLNSSDPVYIRLLDVQGRILREQFFENWFDNESAELRTGEIPGGLYFLQVSVGEEMINKKLVINH